MEDIFKMHDFELDDFNAIDETMTADEFILKTKKLLQLILDEYSRSWKLIESEDEDGERLCKRCSGFTYIEQGGYADVECPSCNGTGNDCTQVFDSEEFIETLEQNIMFGKEPFLELLHCKISD